jgi:hypothetical protein
VVVVVVVGWGVRETVEGLGNDAWVGVVLGEFDSGMEALRRC